VGEPRIRCALITSVPFDWASAVALSCARLEFVALNPSAVGLAELPNPFALPEVDRADVVVLTKWGYDWLTWRHPNRVDDVMRALERRAEVVVGFDGADQFALGFPPKIVERVASVIKPQGLYRDRDLYNYVVGSWYPGAIWTEKVRPRRDRYRTSDLEKLRLSVPCFIADLPGIRKTARLRETGAGRAMEHRMSRPERIVRGIGEVLLERALSRAAVDGRPLDVHCIVGLTHVQRIEAMRLLRGFSGQRSILYVQDDIAGTEHSPEFPPAVLGREFPRDVRQELIEAATPYMNASTGGGKGRWRYLMSFRRHRVVFAPTGYGEITFRHAEAWRAGATLVCQDLSHAESMFPLQDQENVVFCRPDLSDLRATVEEVLANHGTQQHIAREGRRRFTDWAARWRDHLYTGIEAHVRDALSPGGNR
jgi:hypothetical protein